MERNGWALVAPDGEIWGFAPTKRVYLDTLIKSTEYKQVWNRDVIGKNILHWSGELKLVVPRTFREVWPSYYRRGFRFARARQSIVIMGASNG